jgi:hypothetical protein
MLKIRRINYTKFFVRLFLFSIIIDILSTKSKDEQQ